MKKGDQISFYVANYDAGLKLKEQTDEVAEGTIIDDKRDGGFVVKVEGEVLPFFVTPDNIISEKYGTS